MDWIRERTPETKKEIWTAAGSHHVKRAETAGRPQIMALVISGERFIAPVSPPFWGRVLVCGVWELVWVGGME